MEHPSTEIGAFLRSVMFLSAFTAAVACIVYLFFKFTTFANVVDQEDTLNGPTKGSLTDLSVKGNMKVNKKKKVKGQRQRTSSKQDHVIDSPWFQTGLKGHATEVVSLAYSPNFKYLASVGNDRVVFLWHTKNFSSSDHTQYRVNLGFDAANALCFSPDSKAFMISKNDKTLEVYKIGKKGEGSEGSSRIQSAVKIKTDHTSLIVGIGIHPKFVMSCEEESRVSFWNFKGVSIDSRFVVGEGRTYLARFSPCGKFLAVCGKFRDNMNLFKFEVGDQNLEGPSKILSGKKGIWTNKGGEVYAFDWSQDSSKVVAIGSQNATLVWKLFDVQGLRAAEICGGPVPSREIAIVKPVVRMSSDGFLLLIGIGNSVQCFSLLMGGIPVGTIADVHFDAPILDIAFGENDKQFVTCGDKTIRVFLNVPGKREMLRQMEKQVGDKNTGSAMRTRLKSEIVVLEQELRPYKQQ